MNDKLIYNFLFLTIRMNNARVTTYKRIELYFCATNKIAMKQNYTTMFFESIVYITVIAAILLNFLAARTKTHSNLFI